MRTQFDRQLEELHIGLITMGALCEDTIASVAKALLDDDSERLPAVFDADSRLKQMERDVESQCFRLLLYIGKQTFPDVLPPRLLVHAQIVNEQRCKRHHIGGKGLLLDLAEGIADADIVRISGNVDGLVRLLQQLCQLAGGVFGGAGYKDIRADLCVNLQYLPQQRKKSGNVFFFCLANFHFSPAPS